MVGVVLILLALVAALLAAFRAPEIWVAWLPLSLAFYFLNMLLTGFGVH